jgi:hypothetical protein
MRAVKAGLLMMVVALLAGTSTVARACDVFGSILCENDTTKGVSGVSVVVASEQDPNYFRTAVSDTAGSFFLHVGAANTWYDVNLILGTTHDIYCDPVGTAIRMQPILVSDPVQCPAPPPPPPPACTPTMPTGVVFPYCPARPLGNPKAECDFFGLTVLDKTDFGGPTVVAAQTAPLALVKAGSCYDVAFDVVAGETVLTAPFSQAISHVTYCTCK